LNGGGKAEDPSLFCAGGTPDVDELTASFWGVKKNGDDGAGAAVDGVVNDPDVDELTASF